MNLQARQLPAEHGWRWISAGFSLFRKNSLIWIVLTITLFFLGFALSLLPIIGQLLFTLASPVFLAGLVDGARTLARGGELEISHLFAGFRKNATPLVTLGGIYLVGQLLIFGAMLAVGGSSLYSLFVGGEETVEYEGMLNAMLLPLLLGIALSIPLMMALWFAPVLVYFDDVSPLNSISASFYACLANIVPFVLYGVILFVLAFIATIPFGLGFLVLIPTIIGSIYQGYVEIFATEQQRSVDIPR
jgi:uncharacterized membrane protein